MFRKIALFFWRQRNWLLVAAIVIVLLWATIAPQLVGGFPDADSYYHGHITELMIKQRGFVHDYPWLTKMVYNDYYVDGHLGYHLWLIPFIAGFGLELGMRLSAIVGGCLAIASLYWGLRRLSPRWSLWLIWIGVLTNQFMFRMSLPRAPSLAILILVPFIIALTERRWRLVGLITFVFAAAYHSWPVLTLMVILAAVAERLTKIDQPKASLWPLFGWHTLGLAASYLLNPYFPENIKFSWLDIFKIGLFNDRQAIRVGGEWYPTSDGAFIAAVAWPTLIIAAVLMTTLLVGAFHQHQLLKKPAVPRRTIVFLALLSMTFFVLAAGAQRYFEYLIPAILLLCATILPTIEPFIDHLRAELVVDRPGRIAVLCVMITLIVGPFATDARELAGLNHRPDTQTTEQYQPALDALAAVLPAGSVIFHNRWDDGPALAYTQPSLRYLIGLDPTFFYDYDQTGYRTWQKLNNGQSTDVVADLKQLGAVGALIRTNDDTARQQSLALQLAASNQCQQVYSSAKVVAFTCN